MSNFQKNSVYPMILYMKSIQMIYLKNILKILVNYRINIDLFIYYEKSKIIIYPVNII